jgi:hypothetical protein
LSVPDLPRNNPKKALLSAIVAGALTLGFAGMMAKSCGAPVKQQSEPANAALELVDKLASRLVLGLDSDATMQYTMPSGGVVIVSQSSPRRAYRSAGVTYISTPDGTYLCTTVPAAGQRGQEAIARSNQDRRQKVTRHAAGGAIADVPAGATVAAWSCAATPAPRCGSSRSRSAPTTPARPAPTGPARHATPRSSSPR